MSGITAFNWIVSANKDQSLTPVFFFQMRDGNDPVNGPFLPATTSTSIQSRVRQRQKRQQRQPHQLVQLKRHLSLSSPRHPHLHGRQAHLPLVTPSVPMTQGKGELSQEAKVAIGPGLGLSLGFILALIGVVLLFLFLLLLLLQMAKHDPIMNTTTMSKALPLKMFKFNAPEDW
ncbi:hypothetical protein VTN00DRAFT_3752 [Thermoascus crustaceus]|uniref:uncharacterized protein n=1 Tax=Thermoascus crustaceus TaxID=5088 RepID=UPI00374403B8